MQQSNDTRFLTYLYGMGNCRKSLLMYVCPRRHHRRQNFKNPKALFHDLRPFSIFVITKPLKPLRGILVAQPLLARAWIGSNGIRITMAAVCFVSCVVGKGCYAEDGGGAPVANGVAVAEAAVSLPISTMKRLCAAGGKFAASLLLPDGSPEQRAEVQSISTTRMRSLVGVA